MSGDSFDVIEPLMCSSMHLAPQPEDFIYGPSADGANPQASNEEDYMSILDDMGVPGDDALRSVDWDEVERQPKPGTIPLVVKVVSDGEASEGTQ